MLNPFVTYRVKKINKDLKKKIKKSETSVTT